MNTILSFRFIGLLVLVLYSCIAYGRADTVRYAIDSSGVTIKGKFDCSQKVFQKPVKFYNTIFSDTASFWNVNFEDIATFWYTTFKSKVTFWYTTFTNYSNWGSVNFEDTTVFRDVIFEGDAGFWRAKFRYIADFKDANFKAEANFGNANFEEVAEFVDANFESKVDFRDVNFGDTVYFWYSNFEDRTDFLEANFEEVADFWHANFEDIAQFAYSNFLSTADFSSSTFKSILDLEGVFFCDTLDLSSAQFHDEILLDSATLPTYLNLYKVREIAKELDFTYCQLDTTTPNYKCQINLVRSNISKIRIKYELFELAFPANATYSDTIQVYERLLAKLKSDGNLVDYELFDIDYRDIVAQNKGGVDLLFSKFQKWWWRYGYSPGRVFIWTVIAFLVLSVINTLLFRPLREKVYEIKPERFANTTYKAPKQKWLHIPNGAWWAVKHFANGMFYTAMVFFGLKLSIENFKRFNIGTVYLLLFNYLPGLICLGYIVNIVIVK